MSEGGEETGGEGQAEQAGVRRNVESVCVRRTEVTAGLAGFSH